MRARFDVGADGGLTLFAGDTARLVAGRQEIRAIWVNSWRLHNRRSGDQELYFSLFKKKVS